MVKPEGEDLAGGRLHGEDDAAHQTDGRTELGCEELDGLLRYGSGLNALSSASSDPLNVGPSIRKFTAIECEVVEDVTNVLALAMATGLAANETVHLSIEAWTQLDDETRMLCEARAMHGFRRGRSSPDDFDDDDEVIAYVDNFDAPTPDQVANWLRDLWALAASVGLSPYEVAVAALAHAEMLFVSAGLLLVQGDV